MGQVNCRKHYLSLRKSLVLYVIAFVVLAVFLSVTTFSICGSAAEGIRASYPPSGEKYYLTNEQGEQLGDGAYIGIVPVPMSKEDERTIALLEKLPIVATPIYSAFCIIAAALLFYKNRLKKPLAELRAASEKIANNDLDFSINLKDFYYWYLTDVLVEVPDEVAEELIASKRREAAHAERVRYNKAYYSLDCDDGIEYSACLHEPSPQELMDRKELFFRLWNALNSLPEIQGRRVDAHLILGKSYRQIAREEGVDKSAVRCSVKCGIERMKKYLQENF